MQTTAPLPTDINGMLHELQDLSTAERSACALRYAAKCLEFAAYENAQGQTADDAASLINMAAHLEILARGWSSPLN